MNINDFYKLLYDFVKNQKRVSEKHNQLQTFVVLENFSDLNTPNLGKTVLDKNKPYFFSRKWAKSKYNPSAISYEYPILAVIETGFNIENAFSKSKQFCTTLEVAILDKKDKNCKTCSNKDLVVNDLFINTKNHLNKLITYLDELNFYSDGVVLHKSITKTGDLDNVAKRHFNTMLRTRNNSLNGVVYASNVDDLYGVVVTLNVCFVACATVELDVTNYSETYDKGCLGC